MPQFYRESTWEDLHNLCMEQPRAGEYCLTDEDHHHTSLGETSPSCLSKHQLQTALGLLLTKSRPKQSTDVPTLKEVYFDGTPASGLILELQRRRHDIEGATKAVKEASSHTCWASSDQIQRLVADSTYDFDRLHKATLAEASEIVEPYISASENITEDTFNFYYPMMENLKDAMTNGSPHTNPYPSYGRYDEYSIAPEDLLDHELCKDSISTNDLARAAGSSHWHIHNLEHDSEGGCPSRGTIVNG